MPELDLTAYLDGEAGPEIVRRLDARLRSDPRLRAEALRLVRQRVLLARVLPTLAVRPQRRWRIIAAAVATAAGLTVGVLLYRATETSAPAAPPPSVASNHAILLADGTSWEPGRMVRGGSSGPVGYKLADGTVLNLAVGTTLMAATAGSAWRLDSGSLTWEAPAGGSVLSGGIMTEEAQLQISGGATLARDPTGTRITAAHGRAQDRLTGATQVLDGRMCWIPAGSDPPRSVDGASGTVRGIVVAIDGRQGMSLRTRHGVFDFRPQWVQPKTGGRGGFDTAPLRDVHVGEAVEIDWRHSEHLRVIAVRRLAGIPADAVIPQPATPADAAF